MGKIRVLLADDHAIVRAGIRRMIEQIEILEVADELGNGPQVFSALEKEQADLLIIDVTMPDFEPISAIRRIRELYPDLKILVVSAYDDDFYVKGLLGAGVNGYHLKDQSLNDLKLAIQRVLEGERWISSALISKLVITPEHADLLPDLTDRQRDMLNLLRQGCDNKAISQQMNISIKTVENHLTRLYRKIDVQSRLEAVNFLTRFPQIMGTPGSQAAREDGDAPRGGINSLGILVVDDNNNYRKQLLRMIGKASPQAVIYEAEGVQEALKLAEKVEFRLAFVDVILGDENGITCTRRLKILSPHTRIVLISAYPDREFHRQGIESGAAAFLDKKNLDLPTLKQVIYDVIN